MYLVIVVDHEKSFLGSRYIDQMTYGNVNYNRDQMITNFLRREFPNISLDHVLFIHDDKIVEEWMHGMEIHKSHA